MKKLLWLVSSRPVLRETGIFTVLGGALSFVSDVFGVLKSSVEWTLIVSAVLLSAALVWSGRLVARLSAADLEHWAKLRQTDPLKQHRPAWRLPLAADSVLLLFITTVLLLLTWVGRLVVRVPEETPVHGLFATLVPAVGDLQRSMHGVERDLGEIKGSLEKVKLETSTDPRKELANLGVEWSADNFLQAVRDGDARLVRLFLAGDINVKSAQSQGRPLPIMLALNEDDPGSILDLLVGAGLDLDHEYPLAGGMGPRTTTLIGRAIETGNARLVQALILHRADLNRPIESFGAMGMAIQTFPLLSAVRWKQYEIAEMLVEAGADQSAGDHAAFRELQARAATDGPGPPESLIARLTPSGATKERVDLEIQLRAVEAELNAVALGGIRASPGSGEKARLDRRYDELQVERARIRRALGETQ